MKGRANTEIESKTTRRYGASAGVLSYLLYTYRR